MSNDNDKYKASRRRQKDENAVKKQTKIAKEHGTPIDQPHKFHKKHAMDCGNPQCPLCGNPRRTHKDKLTQQEKSFYQNLDNITDKHSNGLKPDEKDLL